MSLVGIRSLVFGSLQSILWRSGSGKKLAKWNFLRDKIHWKQHRLRIADFVGTHITVRPCEVCLWASETLSSSPTLLPRAGQFCALPKIQIKGNPKFIVPWVVDLALIFKCIEFQVSQTTPLSGYSVLRPSFSKKQEHIRIFATSLASPVAGPACRGLPSVRCVFFA